MGSGASIESSQGFASWKMEATKDPEDLSEFQTEEALKGEITRLRREIRKQVDMIASRNKKDVVLDDAINSLLDRARKVELCLTPVLQEIAANSGSELTGLQFKFKSFHSLKRKIGCAVESKERSKARHKFNGGVDINAIVNSVTDALRYTLLIDSSKYTETVKSLRLKLSELNFTPKDMKNYWSEGDMYQGINDVFYEKDAKINVEVQYHTPQSWELKSDCHVIYEKFRICSEPLEQQKLFAEGVALAATLPIPPGVLELPKLVKKSAPQLLDAYASQIVAASSSVKSGLVSWCQETCPSAKSISVFYYN